MTNPNPRVFRDGRFLRNFHIEKGLLTREECNSMIEHFKTSTYQQAGVVDNEKSIGNDIKSIQINEVRKGHLVYIDASLIPNKIISNAFRKMYYCLTMVNFGWNVLPLQFIQLTEYDSTTDGGFYKRHRDVIVDQHPQRIVSTVVQLSPSESYTGCELKFDEGSGMPNCNEFKEQGDAIFFLSDEPHEVTTITSGVRYSLVGWFVGTPAWSKDTLPSHY